MPRSQREGSTGFAVRWGIIFLVGAVLAFLGMQRYDRDVSSLTPEQLLRDQQTTPARVMGTILGGSLTKDVEMKKASFRLQGTQTALMIQYQGEDLDDLRELKVLVIRGQWSPSEKVFHGTALALLPNYGFVLAAYLIGILPALLFLYLMERRLGLLYNEVKEAKLYEPEGGIV